MPAPRGEHIIQEIVHQEFSPLQQRECEVAILTPIEWIDICQLRCVLRQQLGLRQDPTLLALKGTGTAALALVTYQLATAHVDSVAFGLISEASQIGMAAWFVSALVCSWFKSEDSGTPCNVSICTPTGSCETISNISVAPTV